MPKGKPKATAAPAKTAAPATETKAPAAEAKATNGQPKNKLEGVRWALEKLGKEAKPLDIQGWLKKTYKVDMPVSTITNYKSTLLNKTGGKKQTQAKASSESKTPTKAPGKVGRPPKAAKAHPITSGTISLDDIRAVKAVADRIGAQKVQELATVLAK